MTARPPDTVDRPPVPRHRLLLFLAIAAVGLAADLASKHLVFARLWPPGPDHPAVIWLWTGQIGLQVSLNEGALFGIGQGLVPLFVVFSLLAGAGIVYWLFVLGEAHSLWLTVALAAIMGGILGNLYDRLGLHGLVRPDGSRIYAVRDWILFQWDDSLRWPNFNLADSLLVCGAVMLLLHAFLPQRNQG